MVAYSFKQRFVAPISTGLKQQTIRAIRLLNRHAQPGEAVQLYTGMRTEQCALIGRAICLDAQPIRIDFSAGLVSIAGGLIASPMQLNTFAARDGFEGWEDMRAFWDSPAFEGVLIRWYDWTPAKERGGRDAS